MTQLRELVTPFTASMVKTPPSGHGRYVSHNDYVQRAISVIGPHDFHIVELIRGLAPGIKTEKNEWPAREDAVLGCLATLEVLIDGKQHSITEPGDVDNPAMNHDGSNAKVAASDAYKRCWMRLGLGLHLWCDSYWLDVQLDKVETAEKALTEGAE